MRVRGEKDSKDMGIREDLVEKYGQDFLFADGFDSAIIGCAVGFDSGRVVNDYRQMGQILMEEGCTEEEAWEHLEFNTLGAYVGEQTPIYVNKN